MLENDYWHERKRDDLWLCAEPLVTYCKMLCEMIDGAKHPISKHGEASFAAQTTQRIDSVFTLFSPLIAAVCPQNALSRQKELSCVERLRCLFASSLTWQLARGRIIPPPTTLPFNI